MNETLVLSCMAVIGAMPIFLLVAALTRNTVKDAQESTMAFLERWGGIAPNSVKTWVTKTIGSTVGFALLIALTAAFNKLGDGPLVPHLSGLFQHFGNKYTQWSESHDDDWRNLRDGVRINWAKAHHGEDLTQPNAWEEWKNRHGKENVRIPRTLIFFSLILALAGLVDLIGKTFRQRGALLLTVGLVASISCLYIWADRKNSYVHNVALANETLNQYKVATVHMPK